MLLALIGLVLFLETCLFYLISPLQRNFLSDRLLGQLIAGRELPRMAAVLGINETGAPVLLNLTRSVSHHLLISGDAVSGQSLLHTMALSLVMLNRQRDLQLVAIGDLQHTRRNWPHLLNLSLAQINQLAQSVTWMEQKQARPHLIVVIENLDRLSSADQNHLRSLLKANVSAEVHVIATTANPAIWPEFLAQAWSTGDTPGLFQLVAGSERAEIHTATATAAETEAAIIQLRTGRKSRVWTVQETLPARSTSSVRRLLGN